MDRSQRIGPIHARTTGNYSSGLALTLYNKGAKGAQKCRA